MFAFVDVLFRILFLENGTHPNFTIINFISLMFCLFFLPFSKLTACLVDSGPPFLVGMILLALCAPSAVSIALFQTIAYYVMALPCMIDGNCKCLEYDMHIEGTLNFGQMANDYKGNPRGVALMNDMARLCKEARADITKNPDPSYVSIRTCKLVADLAKRIRDSGLCPCDLLTIIGNVQHLLAILTPESLAKILSPHNLKYFPDVRNLANVLGSLPNLPAKIKDLISNVVTTLFRTLSLV